MYIDSSDILKARVIEFLERYGDKGVVILKTAIEIAYDGSPQKRLGDFSYQQLVMRLRAMGIDYNPANLLRILEREYGIIEKTFDSSNQKWYRFVDLEVVKQAIDEYMGIAIEQNDPRIQYIKIKYKVLEPHSILRTLKSLASKNMLSRSDKAFFKEFVFTDLSRIVDVMEEMMQYQEVFRQELNVLNEILMYSMKIADTINKSTQVLRQPSAIEHRTLSRNRSSLVNNEDNPW